VIASASEQGGRLGVVWRDEEIGDSSGGTITVASLNLSSVSRPTDYPIVADSCTATGQPVFRIND